MRWRFLARCAFTSSLVALVSSRSVARADPGTSAPDRKEVSRGGRPGSDPPLEAPHVRLTIDPSGDFTWVLRIENTDTIPLRLIGDTRLLSFDVTPPSPAHAATVHCALPEEMRLSSDEESDIILPPQLSYVETFDPRLYCFDVRQDRALTAGAKVVARFGFAARRSNRAPPYVLTSPSSASNRAATKEIASDPFTLPERSPSSRSEVFPPTRLGDLENGEAAMAAFAAPLLTVSTPPPTRRYQLQGSDPPGDRDQFDVATDDAALAPRNDRDPCYGPLRVDSLPMACRTFSHHGALHDSCSSRARHDGGSRLFALSRGVLRPRRALRSSRRRRHAAGVRGGDWRAGVRGRGRVQGCYLAPPKDGP